MVAVAPSRERVLKLEFLNDEKKKTTKPPTSQSLHRCH